MESVKLNPKKILIRGVNWIGDNVMSMPAVYQLRRAFPEAGIYLLLRDKLSGLWKNNADINGLLTFSEKDSIFSVARKIREHNFDLAVVFPNSLRSALEVWLAKIPNRIGFNYGLRSLFLTNPVEPPHEFVKIKKLSKRKVIKAICEERSVFSHNLLPRHHHIYNYLRIVGEIGASEEPVEPRINVKEKDIEDVVKTFNIHKFEDRKILGINPGAEYGMAKMWSIDRFMESAVEIQHSTKCGILIFGGEKDKSLCDFIFKNIKHRIESPDLAINLAGKTSLNQLCAAMRICDVVISNDTGPAHIAAAVGTRVVAIFGSTSPELTGPGLPGSSKHAIIRSRVSCSPCFNRRCPIDFRCMDSISIRQVVSTTLNLFNNLNNTSRI